MRGHAARTRAKRRVFLLNSLGLCAAALGLSPGRLPRRAHATFSHSELQAALIAKIASFVDWPASAGLSSASSPFHVTILGASDLTAKLRVVFSQQPPQGHPARVRAVESTGEIDTTHVLFIAPSYPGDVHEVVRQFERTATLTMGSAAGLCARGVAINLIDVDAHLGFEINRVALRRAGLRASYHLLSRAHIVDGP
jgi:hypothetical protein